MQTCMRVFRVLGVFFCLSSVTRGGVSVCACVPVQCLPGGGVVVMAVVLVAVGLWSTEVLVVFVVVVVAVAVVVVLVMVVVVVVAMVGVLACDSAGFPYPLRCATSSVIARFPLFRPPPPPVFRVVLLGARLPSAFCLPLLHGGSCLVTNSSVWACHQRRS